jgi:glycerophosphoryl diester phosphodiesterase
MTHFLVFGHRGSPRRFPENTVDSFEEALRAGADGFETDLRILADRETVLFHDDELHDAAIESLTSEQCRQQGATMQPLRDLARFATRGRMILEVKRSGWQDDLVAAVSSWPDIVVASFDHALIADLHRRRVPFPLGVTVSARLVNTAAYVQSTGATWFFPNHRYIDAQQVDALHHAGIKVIPWTPNREEQWRRLRQIGCDGVITDEPGLATEWRKREPGPGGADHLHNF